MDELFLANLSFVSSSSSWVSRCNAKRLEGDAAAVRVRGGCFFKLRLPLSMSVCLCPPSSPFLPRSLYVSSLMDASTPDGTRWQVLYTRPNSRLKHDGFLKLRYMNGGVVKWIYLFDSDEKQLAKLLLRKGEAVPSDGASLVVEGYAVSVEAPGVEDLPCPPSSSTSIRPQRAFARISSSRAPPHPVVVDRAPIANVGTKWNVLYTRIIGKKVKKVFEGVLRLDQKNHWQQKIVLCDDEGDEIDERFLGGAEEITCGKTLRLQVFSVEVVDIKGGFPSLAEVVVIQDSPENQKMPVHRQHPKSSFQGMATSRASPQDRVEQEIWEVIHDSGTERIRAPSKPCGKQEIQPKRRDSGQIMSSLKRPVNSFSRESSITTNSCTRESVETEGTSMLPSTSQRQHEEERSAPLDFVDRIQKLNVGKACPESFDDDCIYIEHDVILQNTRLGNNKPGSVVINLDDQFDVVVEQYEILAAEKVESEASFQTRRGFTKCSEEVKNILDKKRLSVRDFWEGYKLYCFGHYSHCDISKEQFLASKMGRVVCLLRNEKDVRWGAKFDEIVRHVWTMMEDYIKIRYDKDCTNLRALMEEFEDVKKLSTSENGSLLLQLIKDDEHGTESLYKHSRNIQIQSTDIFDHFRSRLDRVDSNLDNLKKSSGILSDLDSRTSGLRNSCEIGSVGTAASFSVDSRTKPKEWTDSSLPSFDLGF